MDHSRYLELLAKYRKGDCTDEERNLLDQWYASLDSDVGLPTTEEAKRRLLTHNWEALARQTVQSKPARPLQWRPYWAAAAAVVLLSGLSWYFVTFTTGRISTGQKRTAEVPAAFTEQSNTSAKPQRVTLQDGSVVTLQPGSKIRYPTRFAGNSREVTLVGDAFFEVQKNPYKPFLVYSHDLITKVLGTSFRIKAYPTDRNVMVAVRTGRVSVYSNKLTTLSRVESDPETIGVVLTPNQQVTYLDQEHRLVKTLVEKPAVLVQEAQPGTFTFHNAPLSAIIASIEKAYGVEVVYDEEVMANCFITTSIDQESLYDKLTIICKLLGATYKVIDAQIVISGPGC